MKRARTNTEKLTKVFGLIAKSSATSALLLSHSQLLVSEVMPSIVAGLPEHEIFVRHPGIKPEEIKALRAYLVRFGADVEHPQPLPEGRKSLLLDENIPYTLLPLVSQQFGVSSHVEAEGLSRQNPALRHLGPVAALDGKIARFAAENQFSGLVTSDTDFVAFYKYAAHPVRSINVFLLDNNDHCLTIEKRLIRHQDLIRRQLAAKSPDLIRI